MQAPPPEAGSATGLFSIEQLELRGFSRSLAELHWLLVVLVVLYYVGPRAEIADRPLFIGATVLYALSVLVHRYCGLFQRETRWRLAGESWLMTAFITWLLWQTGNADSPLLNLYLLVLVSSGLTLGKRTTLLQLALIFALYLLADYRGDGSLALDPAMLNVLLTRFAPFVLTTYLVMLLAADMQLSKTALKTASETDELTRLPNRRAFRSIVKREYDRAVRHGRALTLIMIDADGLKPTNDVHGHAAGDRLLARIAEVLRSALRGIDHCARYGGDEFVALLPDTGADAALDAAERIRLGVANTSFDHAGQRVHSTVSLGVASYPADARNLDELLAAADAALYAAKHGGRDRVVCATPQDRAPRATVTLPFARR